MSSPLKHDLKPGAIAIIRGRLWNAVARICSYWASGKHINVRKPETPSAQSPIVWDFDTESAAPDIATHFTLMDLWQSPKDNGAERRVIESGFKAGVDGTGAQDKTTWTRGKNKSDGAPADGLPAAGCTLTVCTRVMTDGELTWLQFRKLTFDQNGRLVSVGEEMPMEGTNTMNAVLSSSWKDLIS